MWGWILLILLLLLLIWWASCSRNGNVVAVAPVGQEYAQVGQNVVVANPNGFNGVNGVLNGVNNGLVGNGLLGPRVV